MRIYICPYCGDELYKTYDVFGQMIVKCYGCSKKAKSMKKNGLTEKEIIKILEG